MRRKFFLFILIAFLIPAHKAIGQEVSTIKTYIYNDVWPLQKGDTITLGSPKGEKFSNIYDKVTSNKSRQYLPSIAAGQKCRISGIKRYIWDSENENVYFEIEVDGNPYFIDILTAISNDEVLTPEGVGKQLMPTSDLPLKDGKVVFESVVEVKGKTKEEIYNALRKWFVDQFRDSKSVIQTSDKNDGIIIGKGVYAVEFYSDMRYSKGWMNFTIDISIRDGRFKYVIYGFNVEAGYDSYFPIFKISEKPKVKSNYKEHSIEEILAGSKIKQSQKYINYQLQTLNSKIFAMDQAMRQAMNGAEDNW